MWLNGLLRMARWAHRPPSERMVKMVLALIVLCVVLYGIERLFGWPEALTTGGRPGLRVPR